MTNINIHKLSDVQTNFKDLAINTIPTPPKIQSTFIDWEQKISPIIESIICNILSNNKKNSKILLVNKIENTSNHNLDIQEATSILIKTLNKINNNLIIINSYTKYTQIYNDLKSSNNYLTPRSTTIKLARYINAHYTLHSVIYDNLNNINLKIQLILVKSGEIICSYIIPI